MRLLPPSLMLALGLLPQALAAQCPDGSLPPCPAVRTVPTRAPDPQVIAVLPFRVTGADSAYAEGVAELVAAEFTGEGGPRAADMGAVLRAWQRQGGSGHTPLPQSAAIDVAAQVGAGHVIMGSVVGLGGRLTFTARIVGVPDGHKSTRPAPVEGPEDSLPELLRRLSANLLAVSGSSGQTGGPEAASYSPQAEREYMAGRAAYRRGRFEEAAGHFERALAADTGFLAAAFALSQTALWEERDPPSLDHAQEIAWRGRARLGAGERALLEAVLGPRFPEMTPYAELLGACERAVTVAPDSPEAWYYLGDLYFHAGAHMGVIDARERSAAALGRSLALDTTAGALSHLLELAILEHDTLRVPSLWRLFRRFEPANDLVRGQRWVIATLLGDSADLRRARAEAESMGMGRLIEVANELQWAGLAEIEVDSALAFARHQIRTRSEWEQFLDSYVWTAMNQGRPSRALASVDDMISHTNGDPVFGDAIRLWLGLSGSGMDTTVMAQSAARLVPFTDGPVPEAPRDRYHYYFSVCFLARWRVERGRDFTLLDRAVKVLRSASKAWVDRAQTCADLLEATAEVAGIAGHTGALARFDSLMLLASAASYAPCRSLELAHLHALRGEVAIALATVRRRDYYQGAGPRCLAESLREEGRLGVLSGDTVGAVRAYRHYLALRSDPEAVLVPQRDSVRAEVMRLEARR